MNEPVQDLPPIDDKALSLEVNRILAADAITRAAPFFDALTTAILDRPDDAATFEAVLAKLVEHLSEAEVRLRAYHEVQRCVGQA